MTILIELYLVNFKENFFFCQLLELGGLNASQIWVIEAFLDRGSEERVEIQHLCQQVDCLIFCCRITLL